MKKYAQHKPFWRVNHRKSPKLRHRHHWVFIKIEQPGDNFYNVVAMEKSVALARGIPPEYFL